MVETAITFVGLVLGLVAIWALGYLKGRWDAAVSIGQHYDVRPLRSWPVRVAPGSNSNKRIGRK